MNRYSSSSQTLTELDPGENLMIGAKGVEYLVKALNIIVEYAIRLSVSVSFQTLTK